MALNEKYLEGYSYWHSRHTWIPRFEDIEVIQETGESINILEGTLSPFFEAIGNENIRWELYFRKKVAGYQEPAPLLTNRAGYPISVEMDLEKGKVILLPLFSDRKEAIKNILEKALPQIYPNVKKPQAQEVRVQVGLKNVLMKGKKS